jgi:hypothetical protein
VDPVAQQGPQPHQLGPVAQQRPQLPDRGRRDPRLRQQVRAQQLPQDCRIHLVVLQPGRGDRLAPQRVHQVRVKPVILQQLHQPPRAERGLERRRRARRQPADHLQDRLHPLGTLRLASTSPTASMTATWERLRCTSIPTQTDIIGLLSELDWADDEEVGVVGLLVVDDDGPARQAALPAQLDDGRVAGEH